MARRLACFAMSLGLIALACAAPAAAPSVSSAASAPPSAPAASASAPIAPTPAPVTTALPSATPAGTTAVTQPPILLAGTPMTACVIGGVLAACGTLPVPEDRSNTRSRQIRLKVAVIPAISPVPKADPLFVLDGGPGGAATEDLGWTATTFLTLHTDRDFVLVDQRGTGGSNRLVAPPSPDTSGLTEAQAAATVKAWVSGVLATLPGDPRFYTTSVAMDDVDDVRAALGYDLIDLYGASYGATAAQYYLRQHADHVRSVVLDGGSLLDVPLFEHIAPSSQRALNLLFSRCDSDTSCHAAFPNVRSEFEAVLARLRQHSVTTSVIDPQTSKPAVIDLVGFTSGVHVALLTANVMAELPVMIHAAYAGEWDQVAQAALAAGGGSGGDEGSLVMSSIIRCSEAWARFRVDQTTRLGAGSYLRDDEVAIATAQARTCPFLPAGVVPTNDGSAVRSDVAVLLLNGGADPQDPPQNVVDAPKDLPNSLSVVVPGHGHTVGHLGCMPSIVSAFVEAGTATGLDTACVATGVPLPPFVTTP